MEDRESEWKNYESASATIAAGYMIHLPILIPAMLGISIIIPRRSWLFAVLPIIPPIPSIVFDRAA